MSNYYHGAKASKQATSVSTPVVADSSIHLIVGTAPVHTVGGKVNEPVYASNYAEAVAAMGYSDEWDKYDICEEIYSSFKLYSNGPIIMVNVLDPAKHLKGAETVEKTLAGGITELPYEAVSDTVEVKGYDGEDSLTETYTKGEDYDLFYTDGVLRLERIESGKIKADNARLNIKFNSVDPSKVTKKEIIGGYDTNTNKSSGFELVDSVYPKYGVIPTLFLAPNFSTDSEVAAIMAAKAENINGLFTGKAIIDADTNTVIKLHEPRQHNIDLRAAQQQKDTVKGTTEVVSVKHILVVTPKKLNPGKVATAAAAEVSGEYAVSYYATYINGKKKLEIDPLNYIYYVNGKDYLADVRKALGK